MALSYDDAIHDVLQRRGRHRGNAAALGDDSFSRDDDGAVCEAYSAGDAISCLNSGIHGATLRLRWVQRGVIFA